MKLEEFPAVSAKKHKKCKDGPERVYQLPPPPPPAPPPPEKDPPPPPSLDGEEDMVELTLSIMLSTESIRCDGSKIPPSPELIPLV